MRSSKKSVSLFNTVLSVMHIPGALYHSKYRPLMSERLPALEKQSIMSSLAAALVFLLSVSEVISQCPPSSGIYLMHDGTCCTNGSYFYDADITGASNGIMCVLPDTALNGGEWVTSSGSSVNCSTDPLRCDEVSSPNANISLYIDGGISSSDDGWYKCCLPTNCSDPNTNIIFANIFRWVQIETITVDLPSDITLLPQTYTLHAIKIGHDDHSSFLHAVKWYYESGSSSTQLCTGSRASYSCTFMYGNGMSVDYGNGRWDYTLTVTWFGENVTSGVLSQSNNNGDHVFRFHLDFGHINHSPVKRNRYIFVTAPVTAPSSLTEVNKTATTITVNWTALDSSDADGYVVNVTSDTDTVQTVQVEGSSNNTITLNGLTKETNYSITIRAYQQLLGPASDTISLQTLQVEIDSASSIMGTTWSVILWSVPSYIPSDYPIITYEIGYHILEYGTCSMVDDDDIDIQMLQFINSTNGNTSINITGLNDSTCYIFGIRAYTDNGYSEWRFIANETLSEPPSPTSPTNTTATTTSPTSTSRSSIGAVIGATFSILLLVVAGIVFGVVVFIRFKRLKYARSKKQESGNNEIELLSANKKDSSVYSAVHNEDMIPPVYEPTYTDIDTLKVSPPTVYNTPKFDPKIPLTLPVSVDELGAHVATCHSNGFDEQYENLSNAHSKRCTIGHRDENSRFNRFKNITVYDDNRIILTPNPNLDMCEREYINASFINGYSSSNKFIASQ
uniref:Fibronectin type-III domain-containing protein n=1 Tax=Amphimedon queenslandica TaxID=400682 RepID=A0A1X7T0C4_AMPQE